MTFFIFPDQQWNSLTFPGFPGSWPPCPSSPIDSLTASRWWAIGCQATAWGWIHRRWNSSGWVLLSSGLLARCTFDSITIGGETIQPSQTVCNLGAYIDSSISFTEHITRLEKTCYFYIRQLRSIRRSLTIESSHALVRALVLTCLDYCNRLLGRALKCLLSPLSGILRRASRLILLLPWMSSVANRICTELHWLEIPSRVTFKLCILAYRCLHGSAPSYRVRYFTPVSVIAGRSHLRSAASDLLSVPRTNTSTISPRAFQISSSSAWNCLPANLRDPGHTLLTFRRKLETNLFSYFINYELFLSDQHAVACCSWYLFLVNCELLAA